MAADSSVGYECSEHWKLQQPENAGWQVLTRRPAFRKDGEVCEAAEKEGPAPRCFGIPWMWAEGCHIRTFLHYWGSDCGRMERCLICVQILTGWRKTWLPGGPELGESPGPQSALDMLRDTQLGSSNRQVAGPSCHTCQACYWQPNVCPKHSHLQATAAFL